MVHLQIIIIIKGARDDEVFFSLCAVVNHLL